MHLDKPIIALCRHVVVGRYGGNSRAGARRNEDGALIWCAADGSWEFAMVIDAHFSAESAELVMYAIEVERNSIAGCLVQPVETAFEALEQHIVGIFRSKWFRDECRMVKGEASCLLAARKGDYLWWLSIGDCVAYVLDPQLAPLGQFALNQRNFYEWVGHINTFDQPVPTYTRGVCNLSDGTSVILLITDGLLEFGSRPFETPMNLFYTFTPAFEGGVNEVARSVEAALQQVHAGQGRDSATVIAWRYASSDR
jgi:serine/threonine protein phosphatase PrpC